MSRQLIILLLFTFISTTSTFAQTKVNPDSLVSVYEKYQNEDTVKLKLLFEIITGYQKTNMDKAIVFADKAVMMAEKINIPYFVAESCFSKASVYISKGSYDEGSVWLNKAMPIYEKLKKRKEIADVYERFGAMAMTKKENNDAKNNFEKAIQLYESCGEKKYYHITSSSLASIFGQMGEHKKAIEIQDEVIQYFESTNMIDEAARCLGNKAQSHFQIGETITAMECLFKSLSLNEKSGNVRAQLFNYHNIATIFDKTGNSKKAIEYAEKGLKVNEGIKNKRLEAGFNYLLSSAYSELNDNKNAILYILKSIFIHKELNNQVALSECYTSLSALLLQENQYSSAFNNYQNVMSIHESTGNIKLIPSDLFRIGDLLLLMPDSSLQNVFILPQNRFAESMKYLDKALKMATDQNDLEFQSKVLQSISKNYEAQGDFPKAYDAYKQYIAIKDSISGDDVKKQFTKKELQYEYDKKELALKYEQQLTAEQLAKQKLLTIQQKQSLTLKEQALILSNKEKDLTHLAYLKEQAEKQEKTQQLTFSEEREKGKERDLALKNQELSAKQKQNLYLGLFSIMLLGGLGTLLYFYQTLRKQKNIISQQNQLNEHTISILSHDIKEPLLGVKLLLKKLNVNDPFLAQASLSLENQINSVNGILNNLLKMKKLSITENNKDKKANVYITIQNVVKELNHAIQTKNITIDNLLSENMIMPIAPEKLQIVVHNLLSNAVKYSYPDQTIKIYQEGNGFCIQDFGVGLSPEQSIKLMSEVKPSQQGTTLEKGNGMGLFLVGMILEGEKIKVLFDSPEIGGTIVKILG